MNVFWMMLVQKLDFRFDEIILKLEDPKSDSDAVMCVICDSLKQSQSN